jgi:two-component system, OmpR family, phosphate regulon sensor histidine kinase PhoR
MKLNRIRFVIFLGVLAIAGIIFIQWYWLKMAYDKRENEFQQQVSAALNGTALKLSDTYNTPLNNGVVKKVRDDYFVVDVNTHIDYNVLENFLKQELEAKNVKTDFEYGIFDCENKQMVYGNYYSFDQLNKQPNKKVNFQEYPGLTYYFGVRFPNKTPYFTKSLDLWFAFSAILLVALSFFGYAIFIILRQRQQYQLQRDFVSNMTHEFKTPIASVKIASEFLDKQYSHTYPRSAKYISIIKNQNERLNKLVENVLQNAYAEKKDFTLSKQPLSIIETLKHITHVSQVKHEDNATISFVTSIEQFIADVDEVHFTNMIDSLIENAVKYSNPPAKVQVEVQQDKKGVHIIIADNGIGMQQRYLKNIFEKFYRIPTGNVHDRKGYGLGLYYVKNIVQKHKWHIKVQSQINEGTKFTITIPTQ